MHNLPVSQPPTPLTPASSISTIKVGILPPGKVLADDLTKATLREGSPNTLKVTPKFIGWKTMKESTCSLDANPLSGQMDNTVSSLRQGAPTTCPSAPGSSRDAAGSGHSPGGSKQEGPTLLWWSLMMIPTISYLWRRSLQFHPFPEMISKDLMRDIFFPQR